MKKLLQIISYYFFLAGSLSLNSQVSFTTAVNFANCPGSSFCYQTSIANADFNSDGKVDLVTCGSFGGIGYVRIFKGDGIGGFTLARFYSFFGAMQSVISADFNNDGKPDIATSNYPANTISVRNGTPAVIGSFSFSAVSTFTTGGGAISLTSNDFNNDGKQDIVTVNENTNNISILIGNGLGSFSASNEFSVGNYPRSLISADFNSDGKKDLAVGNYGSNNVSILLGNGLGGFGTSVNFSVVSAPESINSADFNGDGKLDIVTVNQNSNNVSVLLGNGLGGFGAANSFTVGNSPNSVVCADFNGDTKVDIATANSGSNDVSILIGLGNGSFSPTLNFPVGNSPYCLTYTDFNGDAQIDLAIGNSGLDSLSVLLNNSITGIINFNENKTLLISPNPNNGAFKLQIDNEIKNGELIIYNSLGQKIHEQKIIQGENHIVANGLATGIYHYVLLQNKEQISKGKLAIE